MDNGARISEMRGAASLILSGGALALLLAAVPGGAAPADPAAALRELAGGRARVAWLRRHGESATFSEDLDAGGAVVMGLDAAGGAPRVVVAEPGEYEAPMFVPDGETVLVTDRKAKRILAAGWKTGAVRTVREGYLADVWRDPAGGRTWIYFKERYRWDDADTKAEPLFRAPLDDPSASVTVWNSSVIEGHGFQVSGDGRRAAGLFPWPEGGMADLAAGTWAKVASGCWTSISPDDSGRMWVFSGTHRHVQMLDPGAAAARDVPINTPPGIEGRKVYHPRWSDHPRFLCVTGPYRDIDPRLIPGESPEVFVGRFDPAYGDVEAWARITHDDFVDGSPELWTGFRPPRPKRTGPSLASRAGRWMTGLFGGSGGWPGREDGLVFAWADGSVNNVVRGPGGASLACGASPRGRARYGAGWAMDLSGGAFLAGDEAGARLLEACRKSNELFVEALVTPDRMDQTGPARIVTFSTDPGTRNFTLGQQDDRLIFRLRTPATGPNGTNPETAVGRLKAAGRTHHVLVTYRPGRLLGWIDGDKTLDSIAVLGDFSNWEPHHLLFGDEWTGERDWAGRVEAAAVGARFVSDEEAALRWRWAAKRLAGHRPIPRAVVEAALVEAGPVPSPDSIAPYRRALVAHVFEVRQVLSGTVPRKRILVARWAILDGEVLPDAAPEGGVRRLVLEPFDAHRELKGERLVLEVSDLEAPLFLDASGP